MISRLIHGFAAKRFIPEAPTNIASSIPSTVNVAIIPIEYMLASLIALPRSPAEWFVKYETVIGIIGNTHGVSSEAAPSVIASQINAHNRAVVLKGSTAAGVTGRLGSGRRIGGSGYLTTSSEPANVTLIFRGGMQVVSLHS